MSASTVELISFGLTQNAIKLSDEEFDTWTGPKEHFNTVLFFSLLQNEICKILMNFTGLKLAALFEDSSTEIQLNLATNHNGFKAISKGNLVVYLELLTWNPTGNWVIFMFSGEKRYLWQSEKINFNFTGIEKTQVKLVMCKISFCEIWSFRSLFSTTPIRTLELFLITYYIYSPQKV